MCAVHVVPREARTWPEAGPVLWVICVNKSLNQSMMEPSRIRELLCGLNHAIAPARLEGAAGGSGWRLEVARSSAAQAA